MYEYDEECLKTFILNQGQLLSIPFVLLGIYCLSGGKYCKKWGDNGTI